MQLRITGRHMKVTPALKRYIDTRFDRLNRYAVKLGTVKVIVGVEKLQHTAEAVCIVNGKPLQAKVSTKEMYASIDQLVDRIDAQIRKRKDRLVDHKPGVKTRGLPAVLPPVPVIMDAIEVVRPTLRTMSLDEAKGRLGEKPTSLLVFVNAASGKMQILQRLDGGRVTLVDP